MHLFTRWYPLSDGLKTIQTYAVQPLMSKLAMSKLSGDLNVTGRFSKKDKFHGRQFIYGPNNFSLYNYVQSVVLFYNKRKCSVLSEKSFSMSMFTLQVKIYIKSLSGQRGQCGLSGGPSFYWAKKIDAASIKWIFSWKKENYKRKFWSILERFWFLWFCFLGLQRSDIISVLPMNWIERRFAFEIYSFFWSY